MKLLVLSLSTSFDSHVARVLSQVNQISTYQSIDNLDKKSVKKTSAILIHAASFNDDIDSILASVDELFSVPIGIAADQPNLQEMISYRSPNVRAYFNSYMAGTHYQQMVEFITCGQYWYVPGLLSSALKIANESIESDAKKEKVLKGLTKRQKEIARLVSRGLNNKKIAKKCNITERTVKAHLTKIFEKSGVHDRVSLALLINPRKHSTLTS